MHVSLRRTSLAASLALLLAATSGTALAAGQEAHTDAGLAPTAAGTKATLVLKLRDEAALERYIQDTVTPGSPNYHRFLSTTEFASRYGATDAQIAQVQAFLAKQGLRGEVAANRLAIHVNGTLGQFGTLFQAPIHDYVARESGRRFHRPSKALVLPATLAGTVVNVGGLDNQRVYLSHRVRNAAFPVAKSGPAPATTLKAPAKAPAAQDNPTATGEPGNYTVGDVANLYHINPLYQRGIDGRGSTVAVVTLSNFDPADAQAYWDGIGLTTKPHRITQVHVDGGGDIDAGSGETALDVEQSGGLAPFADVLVYDAPNTSASYVNAFAQAVIDNKADSISTSWGLPEIYNFAALNVDGARVDDTTDVGDLRAFHQIFLEAAVQGQSVFAATGDSGAYDTVRGLGTGSGPGEFSAPLTVDSPASDPYVTAAGGTTTPFNYSFGKHPVESITQESVWGWSYLQRYFDTYYGAGAIDLFSVGGGGGVSVYWRTPFYQRFTDGVRRSEKDQSLVYNDPDAGPTTLLKLPGNFRGRNLPDVSLNADPETGYLVVSTVDGGVVSGNGGTSFVSPQLNGITALLRQSTGQRIGLWNPHLYLVQNVFGYGRWSAFNAVSAGDNWFYQGEPRYNPGAGLGSLDVTRLDLFLRSGF
ncbi:S53 family peptidase [Frateuria defendens]|uniref:S53 family peptidase n=1 Tax=Frateuria defendens TaxID=2219559 RepID=UPI00066FF754|nr:S53 family peptidase [Frateuria defendens]